MFKIYNYSYEKRLLTVLKIGMTTWPEHEKDTYIKSIMVMFSMLMYGIMVKNDI